MFGLADVQGVREFLDIYWNFYSLQGIVLSNLETEKKNSEDSAGF